MAVLVDCGTITGASWYTQADENGICHDWFQIEKGCIDSTCDGNTRSSLTQDALTYTSATTSTELCSGTAPWPISSSGGSQLEVKVFCSLTCDYCPPTTTTPAGQTTTTTSTTTTFYASKQAMYIIYRFLNVAWGYSFYKCLILGTRYYN